MAAPGPRRRGGVRRLLAGDGRAGLLVRPDRGLPRNHNPGNPRSRPDCALSRRRGLRPLAEAIPPLAVGGAAVPVRRAVANLRPPPAHPPVLRRPCGHPPRHRLAVASRALDAPALAHPVRLLRPVHLGLSGGPRPDPLHPARRHRFYRTGGAVGHRGSSGLPRRHRRAPRYPPPRRRLPPALRAPAVSRPAGQGARPRVRQLHVQNDPALPARRVAHRRHRPHRRLHGGNQLAGDAQRPADRHHQGLPAAVHFNDQFRPPRLHHPPGFPLARLPSPACPPRPGLRRPVRLRPDRGRDRPGHRLPGTPCCCCSWWLP